MKDCDVGAKNIVVLIAAMVCLITVITTPALAQSSRPSSVGRRVDELNRQSENLDREAQMRDLEAGPDKRTDQKRSQAITAQVKQDFERLQVVYSEIVLAMSANEVLDYKFISEATAEIKRRASRLENNLPLPQPENNEQSQKKESEIDDGQMKNVLLLLRRHILSFVTNPLFETSGRLTLSSQATPAVILKR